MPDDHELTLAGGLEQPERPIQGYPHTDLAERVRASAQQSEEEHEQPTDASAAQDSSISERLAASTDHTDLTRGIEERSSGEPASEHDQPESLDHPPSPGQTYEPTQIQVTDADEGSPVAVDVKPLGETEHSASLTHSGAEVPEHSPVPIHSSIAPESNNGNGSADDAEHAAQEEAAGMDKEKIVINSSKDCFDKAHDIREHVKELERTDMHLTDINWMDLDIASDLDNIGYKMKKKEEAESASEAFSH